MVLGCIICSCCEFLESRQFILKSSALHSGTLLKNLVKNLFANCLPEQTKLTESYVCKICYTLLDQLDSWNVLVNDIKIRLQERMKPNNPQYKNFVEVACQTEEYLSQISLRQKTCDDCTRSIGNESLVIKHEETDFIKSEDSTLKSMEESETSIPFEDIREEEPKEIKKKRTKKRRTSHVNQPQESYENISKSEVKESNLQRLPKIEENNEIIAVTECEECDFIIPAETKSIPSESHEEDPCALQCPQCPKKWKFKSHLKDHLERHTKQSLICETCGKVFKMRSAFDVHIEMHKSTQPLICTLCDKVLATKRGLKGHLQTHTEQEAKHQCEQCGKRFIHRTSFRLHYLIHSGEKAFKCKTCGQGFSCTSHLKRHMRTHSGEKKHICQHCNKQFAEKYNLTKHVKAHGKRYQAKLLVDNAN